jgi:hypothetical protein
VLFPLRHRKNHQRIPKKGVDSLTAMRNRPTLLRAEQSRAQANCALFASCDCKALETKYNIRDGYPSDSDGVSIPCQVRQDNGKIRVEEDAGRVLTWQSIRKNIILIYNLNRVYGGVLK